MTTALIIRNDSEFTVRISEEAERLKAEALEKAGIIGRVSNDEEQAAAVEAQMALERIIKLTEDSRKAAKAPVLDFGRDIDGKAKGFVEDLVAEKLRLGKLAGDYVTLQEARVRAAEAARQAELQSIEAEQRKAAEAEQARLKAIQDQADEAKRKAQAEQDAPKRAEAEREAVELERQSKLAQAESHDAMDRIQWEAAQKQAAIAPVEVTRAEGQTVRVDWEITVENVHKLYSCHPHCVKLEPKKSEIRTQIEYWSTLDPSLFDALCHKAGIKAERVTKSGVRLGKERVVIEA